MTTWCSNFSSWIIIFPFLQRHITLYLKIIKSPIFFSYELTKMIFPNSWVIRYRFIECRLFFIYRFQRGYGRLGYAEGKLIVIARIKKRGLHVGKSSKRDIVICSARINVRRTRVHWIEPFTTPALWHAVRRSSMHSRSKRPTPDRSKKKKNRMRSSLPYFNNKQTNNVSLFVIYFPKNKRIFFGQTN